MSYRRFFRLLREARRWQAIEQMEALTVAVFPDMKRSDRSRITSELQAAAAGGSQGGGIVPAPTDPRAALEAFRTATKAGANRAF